MHYENLGPVRSDKYPAGVINIPQITLIVGLTFHTFIFDRQIALLARTGPRTPLTHHALLTLNSSFVFFLFQRRAVGPSRK